MPDGNRNILDNVTPTTILTPRASGDNDPVIPRFPAPRPPSGIGPHLAFPAQTPPAVHLSHDLPTAPYRHAPLTREQLDREIAAAKDHDPYLIGYGGIQAHAL